MPSATHPYLQLVAALPLPTLEQTERFVRFVAGSHSWYKHLPILPPGGTFSFFLDPNAGRSFITGPRQEPRFEDRVEGDGSRFHYTWMPTAEYLELFGHWTYHCDRRPSFFALRDCVEDLSSRVRVQDEQGRWLHPPSELIATTRCGITGFVHDLCNPPTRRNFPEDRQAYFALAAARPADPEMLRYEPLLAPLIRLLDREWVDPKTGAKDLSGATGAEATYGFHQEERERQRDKLRAALRRGLDLLRSHREYADGSPR